MNILKKRQKIKRQFSIFLTLVFILQSFSLTVSSLAIKEPFQKNKYDSFVKYEKFQLSDLPDVIYDSVYSTEKVPKEIINHETDDAFSLTVENSDGSNTLHIFQMPIKYNDGNSIKLKKTAITDSKKYITPFKKYAYENVENDIHCFFPELIGDGIRIEYDNYSLTLSPLDKCIDEDLNEQSIVKSKAFLQNDSVTYQSAFTSNISLEYKTTLLGLKENIIINQYEGQNTFEFVLDTGGLIPEKERGDSIPLLDPNTREMKLYIGQINVRDSYVEDSGDYESHFTLFNSVQIEKIESEKDLYKLTVIVDKEFLERETTVYPVIIDPTINTGVTNMKDAPVYSGYPNSNYYTNEYNCVGYHNTTYKEGSAYIQLNTLSNYKYINPEKITNAYYRVYEGSGKVSSATIQLHDTAETWDDTTITYNNRPTLFSPVISSNIISASGWYTFGLTALLKSWLKNALGEGGFSPNYGFCLIANSTGVSSRHFCSANNANNPPSIVIVYDEDVSIQDGDYFIRSKYSNKYLSTEQMLNYNGNVFQQSFLNESNQIWTVDRQSNGYYKLYSKYHNSSKCLDVESNPMSNGSNVDVYDDTSGDYILFKLVSNNDGSYRIISKWSNNQKVLDVCGPSMSENTNIQIWEYVGVNQQKWVFEKRIPISQNLNTNGGFTSYSSTTTSVPYSCSYINAVSEANNSYNIRPLDGLTQEEQEFYHSFKSTVSLAAQSVAQTYPLASDMLFHFLGNSGNTYNINSSYIYNSQEIHGQLVELLNEIEEVYAPFYSPETSVVFGRRGYESGQPGSYSNNNTDWFLAVNRCTLWAKGEIFEDIYNIDNLIKTIVVYDYYDWNANVMATFTNLSQVYLHQLHEVGLAREYPVYGEYIQVSPIG